MITLVLLAGASGSGKSRVARMTGCPRIALDDFYLDGDHPELPRVRGNVDWDDVRSWDLHAAMAALVSLDRSGSVEVPVYRIAANAAVGTHRVELGSARVVVAEGVFAPDLVGPCAVAGLDVVPVWLDRPRLLTAVLRLARDLREARKPVRVLLRRGFALWRAEPDQRRRALAAGCRPLSLRATCERIARLTPTPSATRLLE